MKIFFLKLLISIAVIIGLNVIFFVLSGIKVSENIAFNQFKIQRADILIEQNKEDSVYFVNETLSIRNKNSSEIRKKIKEYFGVETVILIEKEDISQYYFDDVPILAIEISKKFIFLYEIETVFIRGDASNSYKSLNLFILKWWELHKGFTGVS